MYDEEDANHECCIVKASTVVLSELGRGFSNIFDRLIDKSLIITMTENAMPNRVRCRLGASLMGELRKRQLYAANNMKETIRWGLLGPAFVI